ncbi:MAG: glycosyltransferase [Clostridia bacterium]|nr:glycosyltransferase [Clostridia bacterium]
MKIAFATNFYNHHQKPLADAMYSIVGDGYHFIETEPISEERLNMGWGGDQRPSYILQSYIDEESNKKCQQIIDDADVVIYGSAPYAMLENRLKAGKLTFKYCERPYKKGVSIIKLPVHILRAYKKYTRYKNFYVLCASAYTPVDFSKMLAFIGKTYKWAYFTEVKKYADIDEIIRLKHSASILWVARLIELKHPEIPIAVAKRLKADGYDFKLNMIGNGELEAATRELIEREGVADCVEMLGAMKPHEVREHMEKSEIFLFTSDKNEGWGAVLNESMNSACAVVANSAIGSVPFLINDGENGYMYKDGDVDDIYNKVKSLLDNADERKRLGKNAYKTMAEEWNAENAAEKFVALCEKMLAGEYKPFPYASGVCSKAEILKDNWYK